MHFANDTYLDGNNLAGQLESDRRFRSVVNSVGIYSTTGVSRAAIIRLQSQEAALLVDDESIDFCFIDAQHDYFSVMNDVIAWWPKVRIGGILAGHDYNYLHYGCVYAVDEFARKMNLEIHVTEDYSWYIFKTHGRQ